MAKKKNLKIVGVAKVCGDCNALIPSNTRMEFETLRRNPDWTEAQPLFKRMIFVPQCVDCGYNKHL